MSKIESLFPLTIKKYNEILNNTIPEANSKMRDSMERMRDLFFPRWNRNNVWKCYALPDLVFDALHGRFNKKTGNLIRMACWRYNGWNMKTIQGRESMIMNLEWDLEMDSVMVHEICHAVAPDNKDNKNHGPMWESRMYKCLQKAIDKGLNELAFYINQHIYPFLDLTAQF
jgi:hypothetical protein